MANCYDFVQLLETDVALKILMCLGDSADLIRASCVSLLWRDCVLANGLCKQLCLTKFPQLTKAAHIIEVSAENEKSVNVGSSSSMQWQALEREHRVYGSLFKALTTTIMINCLHDAIGASSTDNDPKENIRNTLDPWDRILQRPSYWSSKGHSSPEVPETLTYILKAKFCVVTSISIQPFQAYFQTGHPIYSSRSVRFRMGHLKFPSDTDKDLRELPQQQRVDDKLVWTYTSQEFPMSQENSLQQFKLPEPVLCIGGFLQIELLGRVQTQATDNLYYICVANVQVLGKPLTPAFDVDILEPAGKFSLKYNREALPRALSDYLPPTPFGVGSPPGHRIWAHLEDFMQYIMLRNEPADLVLDWEDAAIDRDEFYHMMQDG